LQPGIGTAQQHRNSNKISEQSRHDTSIQDEPTRLNDFSGAVGSGDFIMAPAHSQAPRRC
jgi:hypothetical protein